MKRRSLLACTLFFSLFLSAQRQTQNLIIITTDGLRWQELFRGMDTAIANNPAFNQGDSAYIFSTYWHPDPRERRKKLMPFLWSVVERDGQLLGNRDLGSRVDNANPYWFSYPGYSEIFTGYADTAINSNAYPPNPHVTVLEYIHRQPGFRGRVAAFGAWEAFNRILNEGRSGIPVVAAFDSFGGRRPTPNEKLLNRMLRDSYRPFGEAECLDVFTHYGALEWLKTKQPRVLYMAYGETDEWAHAGQYRSYLDAARQVDAWIKEIWTWVQSDPRYRNRTTLFITTDHGRGDIKKEDWQHHNNKIPGAHETWYAALGPDTPARGEQGGPHQLYQQQYAQSFARLLGLNYKAVHPVAEPVLYLFKMRK
jgi:hypothetical protein